MKKFSLLNTLFHFVKAQWDILLHYFNRNTYCVPQYDPFFRRNMTIMYILQTQTNKFKLQLNVTTNYCNVGNQMNIVGMISANCSTNPDKSL